MGTRNRDDFRKLVDSFRSPVAGSRREPSDQGWLQPPAQRDHYAQQATLSGSSSHRETPGGATQLPFELDDDEPLDAFDRELLAQLSTEQEQPIAGIGTINRGTSYIPRRSMLTPDSRTQSNNFRNAALPVGQPPFPGPATSSSDFGPPSSPSLAVKNRKEATRVRTGDNNSQITSSHWPPVAPSFSSPVVPSSGGCHISSSSPVQYPEINLGHAPPMVQGIHLVPIPELPDRFRPIFPFPLFNAIQSKCFQPTYHGDHNLVLSAPTGSGKTVIMELAICRLVSNLKDARFKVVYQAPTKSLCSERFRDWCTKLSALGLQCAELTGDTDHTQMQNVQNASVIITTPEKWDSMTRKWKDHAKLMQLVKLFLIDEVHILKETRGATLEAVVSRMKSVGSNVRFVALSATVPNSEDIAAWLGRDPTNQHLPAHRERFGEEFRPVKLQRFVYGYQSNGNDFAFDKVCGTKLSEVISKHSCHKPIIIFCCTRNSAIATSKNLAKLWSSTNAAARLWKGPKKHIAVQNVDLRGSISTGVAFHHAGLDSGDRHAVETGFLEGQISVICCTSTLAVGVNLPCHLVIIKNTASWQDNRCKEYADLEMMQMLGRAGRPQFDDSATAVILTRKEKAQRYEKLLAGSEPLESCLHVNLIDHLNAEIGLGTITDVESASKWLAGTFFFVRLQRNPVHYKLSEGSNRADEEGMLRESCEKDIKLLQENFLVTTEPPLKSTDFGNAMARYYVKFETMKLFLSLPPRTKISEILSAIAQADEFREIRLKTGEKSLYKEINKGNGIKFPIKVDIALAAHKISLLVQSELGAAELPMGDQFQKHKLSFQQEKALVMSHVTRLIRCIIDCQISLGDSVGARNALELARSFGARVWDNSALQMKQIDQVGAVAVRKLANAGINSIEDLESTDAARIEMTLSKNPPFGSKLLARLADFPKPRVSIKLTGKDIKPRKCVKVKFRADVGFINEKTPTYFHKRPVYICFLAETSDGRIIDFRKISAARLRNGHEILLTAELTSAYQFIYCYVMCDEIAGTMRHAELKPDLPQSIFPAENEVEGNATPSLLNTAKPASGTCLEGHNKEPHAIMSPHPGHDEFADNLLNDGDLLAVAQDVDRFPSKDDCAGEARALPSVSFAVKKSVGKRRPSDMEPVESETLLVQLANGKWACNHKCKDKTACKHLCCREGTDRPPRAKKKRDSKDTTIQTGKSSEGSQANTQLPAMATTKKVAKNLTNKRERTIQMVDLSAVDTDTSSFQEQPKKNKSEAKRAAAPYFDRLFRRPEKDRHLPPIVVPAASSPHAFGDEQSGETKNAEQTISSDYGSVMELGDLQSVDDLLQVEAGLDCNPPTLCNTGGSSGLVDDDGEQEITDEDLSILEEELTDYDQYVNALEDRPSQVSGSKGISPASKPTSEKQSSQADISVNSSSTAPTALSSENAGGSATVSSDSVFIQDRRAPQSSVSKAPLKRESGEEGHWRTPSKSRPLAISRCAASPLTPNLNPSTAPAARAATSTPNVDQEEKPCVDANEDVWRDIDWSLLEEFKDYVNFI